MISPPRSRTCLFATGLTLLAALLPFRAEAQGSEMREVDLQPYLCPLSLQQAGNSPDAGVDFVTDGEVLVYTVCHVGAAGLSTRDTPNPGADAANHLKAVLLDLSSGNVIKTFEWPTRGRGAMVRVTHRGELIVQTDNLLRTVTVEGKQIAAIRLVKVGSSDLTFVNTSPAADSLAVIQSSQAEGKTFNGVAVLDAHGLEPKAQWHDDGEIWNIAVSGENAVRTQASGTRFQMIDLAKTSDTNAGWNTVWSSTLNATRPLFLGDSRFVFSTGNSLVMLSAPNGTDRRDVDCFDTLGVKASRSGGMFATMCSRDTTMQQGSHGRLKTDSERAIEVYRANPLRKLGSAVLDQPLQEGFDFALSPSAARVAVVNQLRLRIYPVREGAIEPVATPAVQTVNARPTEVVPQTANAKPTEVVPVNPDAPVIQSTTRLVSVDVVVTDNQSHPVKDLKASDFTVLENGKPQKVTVFSYESPETRASASPSPALPPGAVTNRPDPRQAAPIVILLLDGLNTPSSQQLNVRQQMLKYLTDLKASNARMAVLALGSDLSVLQDFTTDLSSLQAAVKNYRRGRTQVDVDTPGIDLPAATGESAPAPAPGMDPTTVGGSLGNASQLLDDFAKNVANNEQDVRARTTISSLQAIAQLVSGYPGRKSLLWMSSSFPFTLGFQDSYISPFRFYKSYADDVRKTTALLTDANVAVYPIDAKGLLSSGGVSDVTISSASPDKIGAPSTDISHEVFTNFRSDETQNTVAEQTGGKVFRNTNDLTGAIQAAIEDSSSHYVLGYYLDQKKMDGKFHTIQVNVARDGAHVRSRKGYYALDAAAWRKNQDDAARAPHVNGMAATGVLMVAQAIPPKSPGRPAIVEIVVDTSTVSFGEGPEGTHSVDLSFEVAALKGDGKPEHVETRTATADVKDATYMQFVRTGIPMKIDTPLATGRHLLRITVRDNRSGLVGNVDTSVTIP